MPWARAASSATRVKERNIAMKIKKVLYSAGRTGFFFDDQRAIKTGAVPDGEAYLGEPCTDGFSAVRQAGESVSVMLVLEDGQVAYGDCAAVQYSGTGGRDPLFLAEDFIPILEKYVTPALEGKQLTTFREMAAQIEAIPTENGGRLHTAIRYGVTQAILDAVAMSKAVPMCCVVAEEYGCSVSDKMIPIFTQSGDNRYANADKMILKRAEVLPHALINNVEKKLGKHGELLLEYVAWLRDRILHLRPSQDYEPVLHIDVYGTIGLAFGNNNYKAMADYIKTLADAASPFKLRIEGPMDAGGRTEQMEALRDLTRELDERNIPVELVADEWCNTLEDVVYFADNKAGHMIQIKTPDLGGINNTAEAVLYCKQKGIGAYQGGTCNETDRSAQVSVHVAMAVQPVQVLAKPGMGVDEGYMIVYNEMKRILALNAYLGGK